jgi:multiple sugar transport system ATP-binding protein
MSMADRICVMNHAEILQIGRPMEVYRRPATKFVASFIGSPSMNFLPTAGRLPVGATAVQVAGGVIAIPPTAVELGAEGGVVGARPEHVRLSDAGALQGRVFGVEYMGARQLVTVDTEAGRIKVKVPGGSSVSVNERVGLDFLTDQLVLFDGASDCALPTIPSMEAGDG